MTPIDHVVHIGALLDSIDVPWVLGGSLASSLVGEPRSTVDIDLAILLDADRIDRFVGLFADDYYLDSEMVADAIERNSSFNLLQPSTGTKVDMFVLGDDLLDPRQIANRVPVEVERGRTLWVGHPMDQILRKLRWFEAGGEVSDRQWRDAVSILRVQGDRIDHGELLAIAADLDLAEIAQRALADL